jgi:hypothetical protein
VLASTVADLERPTQAHKTGQSTVDPDAPIPVPIDRDVRLNAPLDFRSHLHVRTLLAPWDDAS